METKRSRNSHGRVFLLVVALVAIIYRFFPGYLPISMGGNWDWHEVTVNGFRAGVTREQIEARWGPGRQLDENTWAWWPPLPSSSPKGDLPSDLLTLKRHGRRVYLMGSQFEYHGQILHTDFFGGGESVWQGTIQNHFGPGEFTGEDDLVLEYRDLAGKGPELAFGINTRDQFGPDSMRDVACTTISWWAPSADRPASPQSPGRADRSSLLEKP